MPEPGKFTGIFVHANRLWGCLYKFNNKFNISQVGCTPQNTWLSVPGI
jgi:hypothetical protein